MIVCQRAGPVVVTGRVLVVVRVPALDGVHDLGYGGIALAPLHRAQGDGPWGARSAAERL